MCALLTDTDIDSITEQRVPCSQTRIKIQSQNRVCLAHRHEYSFHRKEENSTTTLKEDRKSYLILVTVKSVAQKKVFKNYNVFGVNKVLNKKFKEI